MFPINIRVYREDIKDYIDIHGGECVAVTVDIYIDKDIIDPRVARNLVLHGVIENFCRNWEHDKVEELVDYLSDALDQLEELDNT